MGESQVYAVFLFPQAIEVLGEAIKPYLTDGPQGPHIISVEIDTGGAFCELTLLGKNSEGKNIELELMLPSSMIRLIVSLHGEGGGFGFA
ncbi:MAG TPA: hypothetical protein PLS60_07720 [Arenimonas sp.]|jgi:hypothetical protein|nr:hypothetical protein [Arenimonas sp.]